MGEGDTYRFDPADHAEEGEAAAETGADAGAEGGEDGSDAASDERGARAGDPPEREFGWRGWVLVGMLAIAFGVVPLTVFFVPRAGGLLAATGLSYRDAFLFLPLIPALLLGAMAVWATTRP